MKYKRNILIIIIVLMLFSLINNYSASFIMSIYNNYFIKELIWYLVGFIIIYLMKVFNIKFLLNKSFYLYVLGNILLIIPLVIGQKINGSASWISFGGVSLQPCEFMKIFLILYLVYFTKKYKLNDFKYILFTFIIVLIPSILTFLEPETGMVISYFFILLAFWFNKKINVRWYISAVAIIFVSFFSFFYLYYNHQELFIKTFGTSFFYQMDRLSGFVNNDTFQLDKALIVIGTSGLFGHGLKTIPEYFPEAPTDFAFALLISNIGALGTTVFLFIYGMLFYYLVKMLNKKNQSLILPIIFILLSQYVINIFMVLGLVPIIGITLPFISYGGSNLLSNMILMGLVLESKRLMQ